ncbi:MAG: outer membrane lipoprotein chaperone LolA [Gammaproteobacteria bacterium]
MLKKSLIFILFFSISNIVNASTSFTSRLSAIQTMSAQFSETVLDAQDQVIQTNEGEMKLKRPGLFYWHVKTPIEQLIVANQQTVWVYDPDLSQVTLHQLDKQTMQTPAMLLSGHVDQLTLHYSIKSFDDNSYTLIPKSQDDYIAQIQMTFDHDQLKKLEINDHLGQTTKIIFSDIRLNHAIDDSVFHFVPPKGVDVITQNSAG